MKILFVAGVAAIVPDPAAARALYVDGLELPLSDEEYAHTTELGGVKHFGLWPLREAALACFGRADWPSEIAVPQASIEFEVEDVAAAADELVAKGHHLIHGPKTEPWGQTVARLLGPEGLLIGLSYAPWYHQPPDETATTGT